MRRILACVVLGVLLAAAAWSPSLVFAQQVEADQQQMAAEFVRLHERCLQTRDDEENIALGEQVLALEAALKEWPLSRSRASCG